MSVWIEDFFNFFFSLTWTLTSPQDSWDRGQWLAVTPLTLWAGEVVTGIIIPLSKYKICDCKANLTNVFYPDFRNIEVFFLFIFSEVAVQRSRGRLKEMMVCWGGSGHNKLLICSCSLGHMLMQLALNQLAKHIQNHMVIKKRKSSRAHSLNLASCASKLAPSV